MGGLKWKMFIICIIFLIVIMVIVGVFLLVGFFFKDEILWEMLMCGYMLFLFVQFSAVGIIGGDGFLVLGGEYGIIMSIEMGDNWI